MVNPILIITVPLLIAFLMPLFKYINKKVPAIITLHTLGFNLWVIITNLANILQKPMIIEIGNWQAPLGINLYIDTLGILAVLIINLIGLLLSFYNLRKINYSGEAKFQILFLMIIAGASGMVLTGDLFNLFIFIEITSIAGYALTTFAQKEGFEAAFKYILIGSIGSVFLLIAIGFTYGSVGSLNMAQIAQNSPLINPVLLKVIGLLFLVGIGIEAELFPLNLWVPDVYETAPTSVSAVLSGAVSVAGIYALSRIFFTLFYQPELLTSLMIIGAITLIIGELIAYQQDNIKRMLAYSSIAQMGLVIAIISIGTPAAVSAGIFQLFNHSILKVLLFITAGLLASSAGSNKIKTLAGLGRKMPLAAFGFTIGSMGILGVPFFNGFVSKMMLINSSIGANHLILTGLILFATIIEAAYYLKVIQGLYFNKSELKVKKEFPCFIPILVLVSLVFVIGVYPEILTDHLLKASEELLNRSNYILSVLGGM